MTTSVRLKRVCWINPQPEGFDRISPDEELTFLPLETIWPNNLDTSRSRPKAEVASGYTRFMEGDILIPKITPTFEASRSVIARGLRGPIGCGTTELHVLRPGSKIDARYLFYITHSEEFLQGGSAQMYGVAGQKRVPESFVGDFEIRLPPPSEQRAIADFLDRETARIDSLVSKKRQLTKALIERHLARIERMVLGVDLQPGAPSQTGFFAHRPSGWIETTIRHLGCRVQTGPFGSQLHADEYVPDGWPVVNPANLQKGTIIPIEGMSVSDEKRDELTRHILKRGDIVFGRRGEMGRAGLVEEAQVGWLCGTGSVRLRLESSPLASDHLKLLLETRALKTYFELSSIGSTMDNLNSEVILGMPCLVPPKETQDSIVRKVLAAGRNVGELTSVLERQVQLLSDHRQALITAAVTGRLDISKAA